MQDYLAQYRIPEDIRLSDITWKQFFTAVVSRFQSARVHFYLADFLMACSLKYKESRRPVKFVTDLLQLDIGKLLSGEDKRARDDVFRSVVTSFE